MNANEKEVGKFKICFDYLPLSHFAVKIF